MKESIKEIKVARGRSSLENPESSRLKTPQKKTKGHESTVQGSSTR